MEEASDWPLRPHNLCLDLETKPRIRYQRLISLTKNQLSTAPLKILTETSTIFYLKIIITRNIYARINQTPKSSGEWSYNLLQTDAMRKIFSWG